MYVTTWIFLFVLFHFHLSYNCKGQKFSQRGGSYCYLYSILRRKILNIYIYSIYIYTYTWWASLEVNRNVTIVIKTRQCRKVNCKTKGRFWEDINVFYRKRILPRLKSGFVASTKWTWKWYENIYNEIVVTRGMAFHPKENVHILRFVVFC